MLRASPDFSIPTKLQRQKQRFSSQSLVISRRCSPSYFLLKYAFYLFPHFLPSLTCRIILRNIPNDVVSISPSEIAFLCTVIILFWVASLAPDTIGAKWAAVVVAASDSTLNPLDLPTVFFPVTTAFTTYFRSFARVPLFMRPLSFYFRILSKLIFIVILEMEWYSKSIS